MSISRVSLCLIFLTFLTFPAVHCSRSPRLVEASSAAIAKKLEKEERVHSPALLVSGSTNVDSPSSMTKIDDDDSAKNSAISGFFKKYKFPYLHGLPFHKKAPFPEVKNVKGPFPEVKNVKGNAPIPKAKHAKPSSPTTQSTPSTRAEAEVSQKVPSSPSNEYPPSYEYGDGGNL